MTPEPKDVAGLLPSSEGVVVNFNLYDVKLPSASEHSTSYGGEWSSGWCIVIKANGTAETSRFTVSESEKEALDRGERPYSNWHRPGWPPRYLAWAYCQDVTDALAAPGAAIAARERRITVAEAGTALIRAMDDLGLNKSLRADIVAAYVRHIAALASRQEAPVASEWRVGLFKSSAYPDKTVKMVSDGPKCIESDGSHPDFIRWLHSSTAALPPATVTPTYAQIMALWRECSIPTDENDHTTGPLPFARALLKLASPSGAGLGGAVASSEAVAKLYVECRECSNCGHVGINDDAEGMAACNTCDWNGPSPKEDHCPQCERDGTMTGSCPECGHRTTLIAAARLEAPRAPLASQPGCAVEGEEVDPIDAELALPPAVEWPKTRDVGRLEDMSPDGVMRVSFDSDNDVSVGVYDERGSAVVEFCTPGSGGGKSSRTRRALIALMVAMEADNAEDPGRDWWAIRAQQRAALQGNSTDKSDGGAA